MPGELEHKLVVKMFGFFDITYKDKSIFFETTSSIKSIAILRFLLAQKGKFFLSETIAENVWPENEYLDEKKVIRTYIHRLRRILSQDNSFKKDFSEHIRILNVKGSYILETSDSVEIDTEQFEALKGSVNDSLGTNDLMLLYKRMTVLYRGEFLQECRYDHWVLMFRNYYLRLFCSTSNTILGMLENLRAYKEMVELCETSLKIYDLDENMNIYFLNALIELNQETNALQHYNFITSKMYNELSVMPSDKMRQVYAKLKSKSQNSPHGQVGNTPFDALDTQTLMMMINDVVKQHLAPEKNRYSVGYIKIIPNSMEMDPNTEDSEDSGEGPPNLSKSKTIVLESLRQAIEFALRKNDMYVITDDMSALLVLTDATEESFPIIANRICQSFYSRHNGFDSKLRIKLFPSIKII